MTQAFEFLNQHRDVAFATVEDNQPKIRVFQIMKINGHDLYFATSSKKEVFKQLQKNPYVEILAMAGSISVRASGKAVFDVDDSIQQEIYNGNDILKRLYSDYKSMSYFRMPVRSLDYYDLTPTPPMIIHKEYE